MIVAVLTADHIHMCLDQVRVDVLHTTEVREV